MRALAFIAALFIPVTVFADPMALRQPMEGRSITLVMGAPHESIGFRFANGVGVAVTTRFPLTMLSADVGYHRLLLGQDEGWSLAVNAWTGVTVPLVEPALAIDAGVAVHARLHKAWFVMQLGAVCPATFRVTGGFAARTPVAGDAWLSAQVSIVIFGLHGAVGATFTSAYAPAFFLQGSAFIGVAL
ncbi:MAG: hypothetical protein IT381_06825 [Deltaproteobacteria bacterium]|nr:hypothetical protein [Deltaproteobacteria bacterium]